MSYDDYEEEDLPSIPIQEARKIRLEKIKSGEPQPFYVVLYQIDRLYGGPEEGGWYWDRIIASEITRVWDWKNALKEIRYLQEEYPKPKYSRGSVLGGTDIEIRVIPSKDYIHEQRTKPQWC